MPDPVNSPLAGLARLATLKAQALPALPASNVRFDAVISRIGSAMAATFDRRTNRKLVRVENRVSDPIRGDVPYVALPAYPIESVAGIDVLAYGDTNPDGSPAWTDQTTAFVTVVDFAAGCIQFGGRWGSRFDRVRVRYTGGFWVPDDPGVPTTQPDGSTPVPDDLLEAFFNQCAEEFSRQNVLGAGQVGATAKEDADDAKAPGFLPSVRDTLARYAKLA